MAEIVKLRAKQTANNALHHRNGPNTTSVHDLPLNSKVLIWRKSGSWNGPYCLLAVENETCCVQLPSGPTSFRNTSIKPYFWPETTYDVKPDELEVTAEPDELEVTAELDEPETTAESNGLEAPLPTLEVPQKPTKPAEPTVKRGQGRPRKHPITKNPETKNHLTSAGISA